MSESYHPSFCFAEIRNASRIVIEGKHEDVRVDEESTAHSGHPGCMDLMNERDEDVARVRQSRRLPGIGPRTAPAIREKPRSAFGVEPGLPVEPVRSDSHRR